MFGSDPVADIFHGQPDLPVGAERAILDEAYDSLGRAGSGRLVAATHRTDGAWDRNYMPGVRQIIIPNEDILLEYRELDAAA